MGQEERKRERGGLYRAQTLTKGIRPIFTVHYISFALISLAKFSQFFFNEFSGGSREIQVEIITECYRVIIEIFSNLRLKLGHD